jgi:N-ethylmaleimide reductase
MTAHTLLSPYTAGGLTLSNRLVLAPMTRSRASDGNVPSPLAATYYAQRASAGLLITEGTQVSRQGVGYVRTPGMHTPAQVAGWKVVTDAVHAAGGKVFAQLWHVGRVSHADFHDGQPPVAPSAIGIEGETFTPTGRQPFSTPRALTVEEIAAVVDQFRTAAANARAAGFDGVELHGANGYLLDQFLRDGANVRTDGYGGNIANRARFPLEVVDAVLDVWEPSRVGYKVAPAFSMLGMSDSNPAATFSYLADALSGRGLLYLHVTEPIAGPQAVDVEARITPLLRRSFNGTLIVNGGYDRDSGERAVAAGDADLVAYGVPLLANPDLVERFRLDAALNAPDSSTFYAGEAKGYTDYPMLESASVAAARQ